MGTATLYTTAIDGHVSIVIYLLLLVAMVLAYPRLLWFRSVDGAGTFVDPARLGQIFNRSVNPFARS
jgi:hypothetical protein